MDKKEFCAIMKRVLCHNDDSSVSYVVLCLGEFITQTLRTRVYGGLRTRYVNSAIMTHDKPLETTSCHTTSIEYQK